jgi:2-amino-4-hydroxy-6-hydroxymethyldihydropteridine diphosphokinase
MAIIALGLGSNLGDRVATIRQAVRLLKDRGISISKVSRFYETPPWGLVDQPAFVNAVGLGATSLKPQDVLRTCKKIEADLGRVRRDRWGPREIDVDLLWYNDEVIGDPDLEVPHPRLHERAFVLVPLEDVAPDWRHPTLGMTASQLLESVPGKEDVRPLCEGMSQHEGTERQTIH